MFLDSRHRLQMAEAHADALRRVGAIVIRPNRPGDDRSFARLAGLDSASVPAKPLLLAEVGGELHAALSLRDGAVIADPFHHTALFRLAPD
jgi:hypothetical protein